MIYVPLLDRSLKFEDCQPTSTYLQKSINRIFDYRFKGPVFGEEQQKKFKLSEEDKKKIQYIIQLGQYDNSFEKEKPYFDLFYRYDFPISSFRRWKIRQIKISEKLVIDIQQVQYLSKNFELKQSEVFQYPLVVGTAEPALEQQQLDVLLKELMNEGKQEFTKKVRVISSQYPLKEKHSTLYECFALLFLCKFLYRLYQVNHQ